MWENRANVPDRVALGLGKETEMTGFRAYDEFVPIGKWSVDDVFCLYQPGKLVHPTTRVEAMYAPEMFGEIPNASVTVLEGG